MIRVLIVVEGERFEVEIIKYLFESIGYTVYSQKKYDSFDQILIKKEDKVIYLIPGPKTDVTAMLTEFDSTKSDLSSYFNIDGEVALNYIVYDVDTCNYTNINDKFTKYNNPQEGLLILSNPCIEVLADYNMEKFEGRPREYKKSITQFLKSVNKMKHHDSLINYIKHNIFDLLIFHIKFNETKYFNKNVLDHLDLAYQDIKENKVDRHENIYIYENLFTMLYVVLAEITGVSKHIENTDLLIDELNKFKNTKSLIPM